MDYVFLLHFLTAGFYCIGTDNEIEIYDQKKLKQVHGFTLSHLFRLVLDNL